MLTATITGPRRSALIELADPRPRPGWSVVDVRVAPLCTEFAAYVAGTEGHHQGHEAMGVVSETFEGSALHVGQRVVAMPLLGCGRCTLCRSGDYIYCPIGVPGEEPLGTLRQRIRKPDRLLIPVPDDLSDADASLACCALGASFGAFERTGAAGPDTILITGLGAVGLGAVVNAVTRGCRVIAVEGNPYRAKLARELGADLVVAPSADAVETIVDATHGAGVEVAVECSGAAAAQRVCVEAVRRRGQIAFVGNSFGETHLRLSPDLIFTGVTMFGSWHYNLAAAPRLLQMIERNRHLVGRLVTHRYPLSRLSAAWETQATGQCGKVLIDVASAA